MKNEGSLITNMIIGMLIASIPTILFWRYRHAIKDQIYNPDTGLLRLTFRNGRVLEVDTNNKVVSYDSFNG